MKSNVEILCLSLCSLYLREQLHKFLFALGLVVAAFGVGEWVMFMEQNFGPHMEQNFASL